MNNIKSDHDGDELHLNNTQKILKSNVNTNLLQSSKKYVLFIPHHVIIVLFLFSNVYF